LFATAASIVFSKVFFVDLDPGLGLFLSFTILAAGYVARPLGGIVFGHFGDKLGRKGVLVASMVLMGGTTVAIGLLPPTATIAVTAPILLTVLRVIQGLAVGGEWGGVMGVFMLQRDVQVLSSCWRMPFILDAVLVYNALVNSMKVQESPIFQKF